MKTSDLIGPALDWAVEMIERPAATVRSYNSPLFKWTHGAINRYSTDWSQGGPISERERIDCEFAVDEWTATAFDDRGQYACQQDGPTELIAKMRCYVASKLGDEVEVPEELQ